MSKTMHPSIAHFMPLFAYEHLPPKLQETSKPFGELARAMAEKLEGPEASVCLRKLLEAKDCAVRATMGGGFGTKEA